MRTRTWRAAAGVLAAIALVATACGGGGDSGSGASEGGQETSGGSSSETPSFAADSAMAKLQQKGKLVVGTKFDQPLFGLKTPSGDLQGFDIQIAKLIAEGLFGPGGGDKIEFKEAVSANREPFLENGTVDMVVATYTINAERAKRVAFAGPYYMAGQDIMVKADNDSIKGVEDLNGKKVCSVQGSTSIQNLKEQAPQADVVSFDTYSKCAEALGDGRVEAVTTDNVILLGLVDKSGGKYKLVENPFTEEPYGIGVPKTETDLRDWVNQRLKEIIDSGEWKQAWEDTVGKVADKAPEPPTPGSMPETSS